MECVMMMCVVMVVWTWFGTWFGGVVLQFLDVFCQKVGQKLSNRQVTILSDGCLGGLSRVCGLFLFSSRIFSNRVQAPPGHQDT